MLYNNNMIFKKPHLFVCLLSITISSCSFEKSKKEEPPFSFDRINYDLKEGVEEEELHGAPWINSNLNGMLDKIEKPSEKDDFYASANYDLIQNKVQGVFEESSSYVSEALNSIFDGTETVSTNGDVFRALVNKVANSDINPVKNYINNFDLDEHFNSSAIFSTYLNLLPAEEGYEVEYNDGYLNQKYGYQTFPFFATDYELFRTTMPQIANILFDVFDITMSTEEYEAMNSLERTLSNTSYSDNYYTWGKYETYTLSELPWSQMQNALQDLNISSDTQIKLRVGYKNTLDLLFGNKSQTYITDTNLRNAIKMRLAFDNRFITGLENYRNINRHLTTIASNYYMFYNEAYLSYSSDYRLKKELAALISPILLEQAYIQVGGSKEEKDKVTETIEAVIAGYKELANKITWLGDKTKAGFIAKLDNMGYESCYSDKYKAFPRMQINLRTSSLYDIVSAYNNTVMSTVLTKNYETNTDWNDMPSYTVNAFYDPSSNRFSILNGIVRAGLGDWSTEEVYALVGTVIGHEMTHAFDSTGSQYDEKGQRRNWWEDDDRKEFSTKVNRLRLFFSRISATNEKKVNGFKVDGEATADIGAVHVILTLAKKVKNFNYDKFFRAYARLWCEQPSSYDYITYALDADSHPLPYLRVNVTLAQFDEFIKTYGIKSGDGMYIRKADRIAIW